LPFEGRGAIDMPGEIRKKEKGKRKKKSCERDGKRLKIY
jgi:hypothetical protein